jgi:hypothetical protein
MTLQDFFISGLPTGGAAQAKPRATTTTERQITIKSDQLKTDQKSTRPSTAGLKTPTSSSKRNSFSKNYFIIYKNILFSSHISTTISLNIRYRS